MFYRISNVLFPVFNVMIHCLRLSLKHGFGGCGHGFGEFDGFSGLGGFGGFVF